MSVYYESSWAILSTIGLVNVLFGLLVISIIGIRIACLIPIVVSTATAVACGLCYYVFYTDLLAHNGAIAIAIADVMWLVQEVGLSYYTYVILCAILDNRVLKIYTFIFWSLACATAAIRVSILIVHVRQFLQLSTNIEKLAQQLHVSYFGCIAVLECVGAFFLIRKAFLDSKHAQFSLVSKLVRHVIHSAEFRLALLALIGLSRAIANTTATWFVEANTLASQVDRFFYTIECLFPLMLYIDILASRVAHWQYNSRNSAHVRLENI